MLTLSRGIFTILRASSSNSQYILLDAEIVEREYPIALNDFERLSQYEDYSPKDFFHVKQYRDGDRFKKGAYVLDTYLFYRRCRQRGVKVHIGNSGWEKTASITYPQCWRFNTKKAQLVTQMHSDRKSLEKVLRAIVCIYLRLVEGAIQRGILKPLSAQDVANFHI